MGIINIENFFEFGNYAPVNRIAYSEEDAKYKLKCMKAMQDLGMQILIDNVGNICGIFPGNYEKRISFVMGSHTDSVTDGGQFDGPVGVYMALKAAEDFKSSTKKQYGNLKTVIYACEESTRFSKACLGSHYLSGELSYEQLLTLKDKQGISFDTAIAEYKGYIFSHLAEYGIDLNNLKLVDKILTPEEISEAVESHIEQAEVLSNSNTAIGAVDSIGKPLRGNIYIEGDNSIVTASKIITYLNTLAKDSKSHGQEETLRITIPQFDSNSADNDIQTISANDDSLLSIDVFGKNNHSGATPMDQRQDAVLGLSNLVLRLNELQEQNPNLHFDFVGSSTKKWGANQIQNHANLVLKVEPPALLGIVREFAEEIQGENNVSFAINSVEQIEVAKNSFSKLFVDVRQQHPATGEETKEELFSTFKRVVHENKLDGNYVSFSITDIGNPIQTTPELLENIKAICDEKNYPCQIMHSWPGHDLACVLPPSNKAGKRILFFIPSQGGSHNPAESTSREAIEIGTDVYSTFVSQRMNKFKDSYEQEIR